MSTITTWDLSLEDMNAWHETAKVGVLKALVDEGLLTQDVADVWCKTHTIIVRKKSFFRTISRLWADEPELKGYHLLVVRKT